jgi:crossover junction endodeoxyribonuclease RuvC
MIRERSTKPPAQDSKRVRSPAAQAVVLGIDVGLDGAVAILGDDESITLHPVPVLRSGTSRREYDVSGMISLVTAQPIALAVIESVCARPGQGVTSTFRFGFGAGLWMGLLSALGIPFQLVTPQTWKRDILRGTTKDKTAAIQFVQRRFPAASLLPSSRSRTPHDGMAEAACLAEWGRRLLAGGLAKNPDVPPGVSPSVASHAPATTRGQDRQGPG